MKIKYFPLIPTMANQNCLDGNKKIWKKQGDEQKIGKNSRREPIWVQFSGFSPGEKIILMLLELYGILKKPKWAITRIIK